MTEVIKLSLKKIVPGRMYNLMRKTYQASRQFIHHPLLVEKIRHFGVSHYCPICNSHLGAFLPFGVKPRKNALCPVCGSLERHRLTWLFFQQNTNLFLPPKKMFLHIAPERNLSNKLRKSSYVDYISADLAPYAMLQMDLTSTIFPDETFDAIYASHVLEHIVDDRKAMDELYRVLKTGGWAILNVPIGAESTYEDPSIVDPKERERIFGQWDHVRIYGIDYYDRLRESGFEVVAEQLPEQLDQAMAWKLGLSKDERTTLCLKN